MNAHQITAGQTFTDDMGHTHKAVRVEQGVAEGRGVYIYVEGQGYPEFYMNETLMFVHPEVVEVEAPKEIGGREVVRRRRAKSRRFIVATVHYIDRKGQKRCAGYTSWDNMKAGVDRLAARGFEILTYC